MALCRVYSVGELLDLYVSLPYLLYLTISLASGAAAHVLFVNMAAARSAPAPGARGEALPMQEASCALKLPSEPGARLGRPRVLVMRTAHA